MNTNATLRNTIVSVLILIQSVSLYGDDLDDAIAALRANNVKEIDAAKWDEIHKESSKEATDSFMDEAVKLYITQVKWSIIDQDKHGGWPFRSFLVKDEPTLSGIYDRLKIKYEKERTPFTAYALIFPALYKKDFKLVQELRKVVEDDSLLHTRLNKYVDTILVPFTKQFRESE